MHCIYHQCVFIAPAAIALKILYELDENPEPQFEQFLERERDPRNKYLVPLFN